MSRPSRLRIVATVGTVVAGLALAACLPEGNLNGARLSVRLSRNTLTIEGWALDPDTPTTSIDVHLYIDDAVLAVRASEPRPDVAEAKAGAGPNHGFRARVNVSAGRHRVCAYAIDSAGPAAGHTELGCRNIAVPALSATTSTAPPPPTTGGGSGTATTQTWRDALVARVNEARTATGLDPLQACAALTTAAQRYTDTMATNQWFDQTGPDGSAPWTRVEIYGGASTGENISYGFDQVATLVDAQLASIDQRANLLRPGFTHLGVGRTQVDPDGAGPGGPTFYWAVELGAGGAC